MGERIVCSRKEALEELAFGMLFLIYRHLHMHMFGLDARPRTRFDALQPLVAVVLVVSIAVIMVYAMSPMW